ncbi:MAG: hypothetical protein R2795_02165 [Saprospiraceae bacterium]
MASEDGQYLYVAIFAAPANQYTTLGGASFLYQALQQPNPYQDEIDTPTVGSNRATPSGTPLNMQDINMQNTLLQSSAAITTEALQGEWTQVMSMTTGDDYLLNGSQVLTGERGYGHVLTLRSNGTYQLSYLYSSFSGGCAYKSQVVETGKYNLQRNTLTLQRGRYDAEYNVCGQLTNDQQQQMGNKQFTVGMDAAGQHLVLRGSPFEYTISQDYDSNGQLLFQEGFYKTR